MNASIMPDGTPKAQRALDLVRHGLYVFPAQVKFNSDGTKDVIPRVAWKMASTNTEAMVATWWEQWPDAYPCVDCGKSGIVVVDCDTKHAHAGSDPCPPECADGTARWNNNGPQYVTQSGGIHHLYRAHSTLPTGNDNKAAIDRHIDVRGEGGMVIAWGDIPDPDTLPEVPEIVPLRVPSSATVPTLNQPTDPSMPTFGQPGEQRVFTDAAALDFCRPAMEALQDATAGGINNALNAAAVQLSHFIGSHWNEETARQWLLEAHTSARASNGQNPREHEAEAERTIASAFKGTADPWRATRIEATPIEEASNGSFPTPTVDMEEERAYLRMKANERARERLRQEKRDARVGSELVDKLRAELLDSADLDLIPDLEYLVKGWLYLDSIARIVGAPGSGKTFAVLDIACKVATGFVPLGQDHRDAQWFGSPIRPGTVLYVVGEGARGIKWRVRAWESYHGVKTAGKLKIIQRPIQMIDDEFLALIELAKELGVNMVILDTQARMTVGVNENDATETGIVVDRAERMRAETGACVVMLHHTSKEGEQGRGSTAWPGALQSELIVSQKEENGKKKLVVKTGKQKDTDDTGQIELTMHPVPIPGDDDQTSLVLVAGNPNATPPEKREVPSWAALETLPYPKPKDGYHAAEWRSDAVAQALWWLCRPGSRGATLTDVKSLIDTSWPKLMSKSTITRGWNDLTATDDVVNGSTGDRYLLTEDAALRRGFPAWPDTLSATTERDDTPIQITGSDAQIQMDLNRLSEPASEP